MKKTFTVFLCVLFLFGGCSKKTAVQKPEVPENITLSASRDTYLITAKLEGNQLSATQKVHYVNQEQTDLGELYFHLYPNAYQKEDVVMEDTLETYYPGGFQPGGLELLEVADQEGGIPFHLEKDGQVVRIPLKTPLAPGESTLLTLQYTVTIPENKDRFGHYGDYYNLTHFYPIACVYDQNGFHTEAYAPAGDPFFSDIADYQVTIELPAAFAVACTGSMKETVDGERKTVTAYAQNVRAFALSACPDLKLYEETVDGIAVKAYVLNDQDGKDALTYAKDSLRYFNCTFGKYPYEQLSVVESPFVTGGMEYPNLTLISSSLYDTPRTDSATLGAYQLELVIAHEIAHQWWYGVVGNDQYNEAFLDEALTDYSAITYLEDKYQAKPNLAAALNQYHVISPYESYHKTGREEVMQKPLDQFSLTEYNAVVYAKGNLMHQKIASIMGKEAYLACLKDYYESYQYDIVYTDDFIQAVKQAHPYDWDAFFTAWLHTRET